MVKLYNTKFNVSIYAENREELLSLFTEYNGKYQLPLTVVINDEPEVKLKRDGTTITSQSGKVLRKHGFIAIETPNGAERSNIYLFDDLVSWDDVGEHQPDDDIKPENIPF